MRTSILAAGFASVSIAFAVVACTAGGSGGGVNGGGGSGSSASSSDFISSYCKVVGQCCGTQGLPSDGSQCTALYTALEGSSTYDSNAGSSCLSAVNSVANGDPMWCVKSTQNTLNDACKNVFKKPGSASGVAPGGACMTDSDCADGPPGSKVVCNETFSNNATTSACQVQTPGKLGDSPCIATIVSNADGSTSTYGVGSSGSSEGGVPSTGFTCAQTDGLFCNSSTLKCTTLGKAGDNCSGDETCSAGNFCSFSGSGGEKCAPRVAIGGDCSMSSQSCADGAYCDMTSKKCTAQLADGAACTTSDSCKSRNCNNKACQASGNLGTAFLCGSSK